MKGLKEKKGIVLGRPIFFALVFIPPVFYFLLLTKYVYSSRYYSVIWPALFLMLAFPLIRGIEAIASENIRKCALGVTLCFLLILSMRISPENFRYSQYTPEKEEIIQGHNCVFLNNGWAKYTSNVFEFMICDKVYIASSDDVSWMGTDETISESDQLIVYIDGDYDNENALNNIMAEGDYQSFVQLFTDHGYAPCYLLSRDTSELSD